MAKRIQTLEEAIRNMLIDTGSSGFNTGDY